MGDLMEVEVVGAIQLPDVERMRGFGVKMDPYCVLQSGKESVKTKRAHGGGRSPNWDQILKLQLQPGDREIAVQVFNYSKLGSHDEVARAVVPLRSWYRQGDQQWEQRVSMQPVAKAGKTVWGGEVLLRLRYVSPQEQEDRRQTWPGQQYPPGYQNLGQQNSESSQHSPSHAGGMPGKLSKPFRYRATTDGVPQSIEACGPGMSIGSSEAADSQGHSPKLGFSLHKALDRVLRKVGVREKSQVPHPPDGSTGTAPLSGHTSRRSSIGSMGLPEAISAGDAPSSSRHTIMPGWQENGHVESHRVSSATQTESPNSRADGESSSKNLSDMSFAVPAASIQGPAGPSDSSAAFVPQALHKEPSFAVTGNPEMHPGPQIGEPTRACEPMLSPVSEADLQQEQAGRVAAAAQTEAVAIPGKGSRPSSQSRRASQEQPSSWTMAGNPAPPSPFATAQEDDFTFSGSCASQQDAAQSDLPGTGSASTQPGTSPGQDSLFALRQKESSTSQQQEQQRQESPTASSNSGRGRRSLESADSAYVAMHAVRQQQQQADGNTARQSSPTEQIANTVAQSALQQEPLHQQPIGNKMSAETDACSEISSLMYSPITGPPPKPQTSPFSQPSAVSNESDEQLSLASLGKKGHSAQPAPRLQYRTATMRAAARRHSTGSGMQPLETSALQAGLKTMPLRIPPLPEIPPGEESSGEGHTVTKECNGHADGTGADKAAEPGDSAQEPAAEQVDPAQVAAGRAVRKTLSRKSPFLPEVLPSLINYEDITYCKENGQNVLLGEGSFGQVYKAQYLECDVAVKKLNRVNDAKSDEAFRREAAILKGCRNPYIVNFMGVCKDEAGRICLVTELMDTSLMSALSLSDDENKAYQYYAEGKHFLICIIKALIYLHAYNIAHLDIKSPNVLIKKGDAKVADVGLSQLLSRSFANSCSFGVGTFSWAATELLLGSHPVTTAADVFSFGVVMWEVCTLEQPVNRYMRTIEDHEAPPAIRKLFYDCITENPAARPTAKQVLEVLMRN